MGSTTELPAINEAVFFISSNSPKKAEQLAARGPDYAELMKPGIYGGVESVDEEARRRSALTIRATIMSEALSEAIGKSDSEVGRLVRLIRRLRIARFVASALSALGASGLIATILLNKRSATVALGVVTLSANFVSLWANTLVLGPGIKESDLYAALRTHSGGKVYAQVSVKTLAALLKTDFDLNEITDLLKESNKWLSELTDASAATQ
jgi:hypothetical protein